MSADDRPRRRRLSDEEHSLWGRITRSVVPLRGRPRLAEGAEVAIVPPDKPKPVRLSQRRAPTTPSKPVPSLEPLERRQKQRLARGVAPIDARLDLHGRTQGEAHAALVRFLRGAQADGARFVLVITGKGVRPGDRTVDRAVDGAVHPWGERGVLRRQVPLWLRLPEFRPYVVGFEEAHIGHGGAGAFYVRVRRSRAG